MDELELLIKEEKKDEKRRREMIQLVYRFYVLGRTDITTTKQEILDGIQVEDFDDYESNLASELFDNISTTKQTIISFLAPSWRWERIPHLIKALLLVYANELIYINSKRGVVINEAIENTRRYLPSFDTTFVNAILDKMGKTN